MPVSSLDLILNVKATGRGQVKAIAGEIQHMIDVARQSEEFRKFDPFEKRASSLAFEIAYKEKISEMTWAERFALIEMEEISKRLTGELKKQLEIDTIAWGIMKEKNIGYKTALRLARQELFVRQLVAESIAEAETPGVATAKIEVGTVIEKSPYFSFETVALQEAIASGNYQLEESFNILAVAIERINLEGSKSNEIFSEFVNKEAAMIIKYQQMNNLTAEQRVLLGGLVKQYEDTVDEAYRGTAGVERWNEANRLAYELMKEGNITYEEAIAQADAFIKKKWEETVTLAESNRELKAQRTNLMHASIGLFVLGITATQTLNALQSMLGTETMLGSMFREMASGIKLMLGPIQVLYAIQQLMIVANKELMYSVLPLAAALGSLYFLYKGIVSTSKAVRAAFGAIGGALLALTILTIKNTFATYANAIAHIAQWVAKLGPAGIGWLPVALALLSGAIVGGLALAATAPKAQTIPNYYRPIKESGLFFGHKGEVVGRVGNMVPNKATTVNITVNIESGAIVEQPIIDRLTSEVRRAVMTGTGA